MAHLERPKLEVDGLTKSYNGFIAVDEVSMSFDESEYTAIIGPNGAGKTSFINLLTGEIKPDRGSIIFGGEDISTLSQDEFCKKGISKSYQIVSIFPELTVRDNVYVALQRAKQNRLSKLRSRRTFEDIDGKLETLLERVNLVDKAETTASVLSHGEKRRLDIALTIASDAELLVFDEPLAGLNDSERSAVLSLFDDLKEDYTLIVVEHNIEEVLKKVDRVVVMHEGRIISDGTPEEVKADTQVQDVYLRT